MELIPVTVNATTLPSIPGALRNTRVGNRMHVDHCIETLRKTIMCQADLSPLLEVVDDRFPLGIKADFNTHKKCRDWNGLIKWMKREENW